MGTFMFFMACSLIIIQPTIESLQVNVPENQTIAGDNHSGIDVPLTIGIIVVDAFLPIIAAVLAWKFLL